MSELAAVLSQPLRAMRAELGTGDVGAAVAAWDTSASTLNGLRDGRSGAVAALDAGWDGAAADAALADAATQQAGTATLVDAAHAVSAALGQAQAAVAAARSTLDGLVAEVESLVEAAILAAGTGLAGLGGMDVVRAQVAGAVAAAEQRGADALRVAVEALRAAAQAISSAPAPGTFPTTTVDVPAPTPAGTAPAGTGGGAPGGPGTPSSPTGGSGGGAPRSGGGGSVSSGGGAPTGGRAPTGTSGFTGAPAGTGGGGGSGSGSRPRLAMAPPLQPGQGVEVTLPGGLGTVQAPNEKAAAAVRAALTQLGVPYVWGGTSPGSGLDCSGLTQFAYGEAGVAIPRLAQEQDVGAPVDPGAVLPGDLAVWDGHVAMVIGGGMFVEAGDPVQVSPIRTENMGMGFQGFFRPTAGESA